MPSGDPQISAGRRTIRPFVEALPKTVDSWVVLAHVALKNGDKATAKSAAVQAIALDPNNRTARDLLNQALGKGA